MALFSTNRNFKVHIKDLQALILAGPYRENPVNSPIAVLSLDNQLFYNLVRLNNNGGILSDY